MITKDNFRIKKISLKEAQKLLSEKFDCEVVIDGS